MKNRIIYSSLFEKKYKFFNKKFVSLKTELKLLETELLKNSNIGVSLGNGLYKIRLANKDKVSGKSGGFRIITYIITENNEIILLVIYDKSEESSIKKTELLKIAKKYFTK